MYCNSNPVMGYDPNGNKNWNWGAFWTVVGFIVGSSSGIPASGLAAQRQLMIFIN